MKKKLSILLCAFAALFFVSCSNLSVDDDAALKADLPNDFEWKVYAKINKDVASSQVIFDVQNKNEAATGTIENCANILKNSELAQKIYQDYLVCPMAGWDRKKKCPGIYAYNTNYSKQTATDPETWQCIIGTSANTEICWRGGWDDSGDNEETLPLFKDSLPAYLETILAKIPSTIPFVPVRAMCQFIPVGKDANEVLSYLDDYINNKLDSTLVIEHYKFVGVYDGRPYKYCKGQHGEEKSKVNPDVRGTYNDYGKYTFCLEENEQKIYVAK